MKKFRYLLLLIVLLFGFSANALRVSHYEPTFEMDEEFSGDQIVMYFGYRGEDANKTTFKLQYDAKYLEYVKTVAGDNFKEDTKKIGGIGNNREYEFTFTSDRVTNEVIYGAVVFKINKDFRVGKSSEIKVYDVYSYNDNGMKYRSQGYFMNLKRDSKTSMLAMRTDINEGVMRHRFIIKILPFVIIGIIFVVLVIVVILLIPAKATENRSSKINAQLDPNNFPIPGVGPFPSVKKKKKRDIIEPEEKVIQPLSKFVSKSDEVNQEIMNKGLEVDKEMFKTNPTKEGEQGLININPLAFDDGEEDVLDTSSSKDDNDIDTL